MRRSIVAMGVAATAACVVVRSGTWSRLRERLAAELSPGALPGELGSRANSWLNQQLYEQVATELGLGPEDELLDVACGAGAFLAEHAARARRVAGLDLSHAKVSLARRRLAARIADGTAEVAQGEAAALPWEDERFTAVTTMDAIGFFPDPARAVAEMHRVLRPGGRVVLQMGFGRATESQEFSFGPVKGTALGEHDVRRMTEEAGFADVTIRYARTAGTWRVYDRILALLDSQEMRLVRATRPAAATVEAQTPEAALVGSA